MIEAKTHLGSRVLQAVKVGDIAMLYTDFDGTRFDALGNEVEIRHESIEVLRRQSDGSWKLIVGDPGGRD